MDRPYRCAYAGAHRPQVKIGVRSRFMPTGGISFCRILDTVDKSSTFRATP
jgi:hypothetical protein